MYDKLPPVQYITPQGFKNVADITIRFKVNQYLLDEGAYPIEVVIPETDRPDILAHRLYGDSKMHWVLLNVNDIVNPFYEWILPPSSLDNYINEKYPGFTMFLTDVGGTRAFEGSFRTNDIVYATGVTSAEDQPAIQDSLKNARVVRYDPQYCRLVIEFTDKTAWIPAEGDYVAGANTDKLGVVHYYVGKIGKVIESPFALNHFENSDGEILDPLVPRSYHNKFLSSTDFGFTFGATNLGRYIFEDFTDGVITNREHEIAENDNKRNIVVVQKQYLGNLNSEVETLLNNG
jgi:hypothetical protein